MAWFSWFAFVAEVVETFDVATKLLTSSATDFVIMNFSSFNAATE
jgi:hypothetical protein